MKSGRERGGERKRGREKVQIGGNEMAVPRKIENCLNHNSIQFNAIQFWDQKMKMLEILTKRTPLVTRILL